MNSFPGANPAFLTRNYLNRHAKNAGDLVVSTGDATKQRLYDMDPLSRWQSAGSSDAVTETIVFGLWIPGARASHDVKNILIQNHNIKGLKVEVSNNNGASYTEVFNRTDLDSAYTHIPIVSMAVDKIQITMTTTQTANEEKKVGGIIVTGAAFQPGPFFEYKPEPYKMTQKTAKMADGSLRGQLIARSAASYHFWAAKCGWLLDPADYSDDDAFDAALTSFREFGLQGKQFVFLPEPGDRPEQAFLCRVRPGTYNDPYAHFSKGGDLIAVQMVIEELGGA